MVKRNRDTGGRVRTVRLVQGYENFTEFAAAIGVGRSRLANIEGGHKLTIDVAIALVKAVPGLTLDWLYFGKLDGLTVDLARRINCRNSADKG